MYKCVPSKQQCVPQTLLDKYTELTGNQVWYPKRKIDLTDIFVFPYELEWIESKVDSAIYRMYKKDDLFDQKYFRNGDYLIKDSNMDIKVVDAKSMYKICCETIGGDLWK